MCVVGCRAVFRDRSASANKARHKQKQVCLETAKNFQLRADMLRELRGRPTSPSRCCLVNLESLN